VAQVTVYEVAQKAGVSIATVSRVLNTPDRVNESTRIRVQQAIDELGFVPKAEAAARARKMHGRIGVLAPFFTFPSFVARLRGVAAALSDSPYELAIYNVDSSSRRIGWLASLPVTRRIDGLIVMALPFDDVVAARLIAHDLPTVLVEFSRPHFSSVRIDDALGGALVAGHFCSIGRSRPAFVGDANVPEYALGSSDVRLEGFRAGLAKRGVDLPERYVARGPHGLENARQSATILLDLPLPPDAVFAASDTQAMGVLQAAREHGLRVPDQLAVVGFDDIDVADYIGLTTVRQSLEESGRVAVDLLLSQLADASRPARDVWLPLTLIKRQTA
jgi:DNA-binding LacI/PurR family transcriptional regulator